MDTKMVGNRGKIVLKNVKVQSKPNKTNVACNIIQHSGGSGVQGQPGLPSETLPQI